MPFSWSWKWLLYIGFAINVAVILVALGLVTMVGMYVPSIADGVIAMDILLVVLLILSFAALLRINRFVQMFGAGIGLLLSIVGIVASGGYVSVVAIGFGLEMVGVVASEWF